MEKPKLLLSRDARDYSHVISKSREPDKKKMARSSTKQKKKLKQTAELDIKCFLVLVTRSSGISSSSLLYNCIMMIKFPIIMGSWLFNWQRE